MNEEPLFHHYSREERLRLSRAKIRQQIRPKGLSRLFGGNKMVMRFVLFYAFLGIIVWFYLSLSEDHNRIQTFSYPKNRIVKIRLIHSDRRYGYNVLFQNKGSEEWQIDSFSISNQRIFQTNLNQRLESKEIMAFFIPISEEITNTKINFQLNPSSQNSDN